MSPPQLMYTVKEVAERLRLGKSSVYALITPDGDQPPQMGSIKIGRSRRISEAQLDEYIARATHSPAA